MAGYRLGLREMVESVLRDAGEALTAMEIAQRICVKFRDYCRRKANRMTGRRSVVEQIAAEISANFVRAWVNTRIRRDESTRPHEYYLIGGASPPEPPPPEPPIEPPPEHVLYPKLSYYLWERFQVHSKRIHETRNSEHTINERRWLHPDLVGAQNLSRNWQKPVKGCTERLRDRRIRLYSFEVKSELTPYNLRESFFQTVSNSSWANFGYLVANRLDDKVPGKLSMLSGLHGIGVIQLDAADVEKSKILIPARERTEVDWDTADELCVANEDFREYLEFIDDFNKTGMIHRSDWDTGRP